ncbi:MAG: hypothetical protein QOH28_3770 [Actinomycetota bacterium]|jgi:hypothetical protein|nr:hypothetical protein [Actinomycetota bacterium]
MTAASVDFPVPGAPETTTMRRGVIPTDCPVATASVEHRTAAMYPERINR